MPIQNKSWFLQKPSFFVLSLQQDSFLFLLRFWCGWVLARSLPSGGAEAGLVGIGGWEVMNEMRVLLERGVCIVPASGGRSHFAQTQMQIIQELRALIFCLFSPFHALLGTSSLWCSLRGDPLGMNARFIIQQYWMDLLFHKKEKVQAVLSSYLYAVVTDQFMDYHLKNLLPSVLFGSLLLILIFWLSSF